MADAGAARVIGTDSSDTMIDLARRHGGPPGRDLSYIVDDAQQLAAFETEAFEGVTCQLGLMDIPDLDATLAAIHRVLKDGGWFAFVIGHPWFLVPDATVTERADRRPAVTIAGYFR